MTALESVKKYVSTGWPVSSQTRDGCWRKAWAESRLSNIGLNQFMGLVKAEGFTPRQFGEVWIIRFPGPSRELAKGAIRCAGL